MPQDINGSASKLACCLVAGSINKRNAICSHPDITYTCISLHEFARERLCYRPLSLAIPTLASIGNVSPFTQVHCTLPLVDTNDGGSSDVVASQGVQLTRRLDFSVSWMLTKVLLSLTLKNAVIDDLNDEQVSK